MSGEAQLGEIGGRQSLLRNRSFMSLWVGQSVAQFGNQFTLLALPTIAINVLGFSVFEVGLLAAFEFLAFPAIGLFVGVLVDRWPRRPILIACNVGRMLALASLPVAFYFGGLTAYQIFAVAGLNGVFSVFFDVAYQSFVPSIVDAADLVDGNSKLQTSASASAVVGPTIAGFLMGIVGAVTTIFVDVGGYLVSVVTLSSIRGHEAPRGDGGPSRAPFVAELREGLSLTARTPVLRYVTACIATANLGNSIAQAVYLFYAYKQLGFSTFDVGLVGTSAGVAFFLGALVATRVSRRLRMGRALTVSILSGFAWLGFPLALVYPPLPTLIVMVFIFTFPIIIFNIVALSMVQRATPSRLLGRMNATRRTISWGMIPTGSVIGAYLGTTIGIPATLVVGGLVAGGAVLWALLTPIYGLKEEDPLGLFGTEVETGKGAENL